MPTTGIINTTLLAMYIDVSGTNTKIAHATDASVSLSHAVRDASTKDSLGWQDNLEGQKSWTASVDGNLAFDATYGVTDLETAFMNRTTVTIVFSTEVTGDTYWSGSAYIDNMDLDSSGVEGNATYSISFTGTGAITSATVSA